MSAPSVPASLNASAASCSQVNLSWTSSSDTGGSGLKGYDIKRGGVFVRQVLAPATSSSDTALTASTLYSYTVSAVDNAGNRSGASNIASTSTPACGGATSGNHVWSRRMGGTGADLPFVVASDPNGEVVATGYFSGSVDFGGGVLTSAGSTDVFVAKYSNNGTYRWAKRWGGAGSERGLGVAIDSAGNVLVTGYFGGTADFGSGPISSAGGNDIFLAKYSGVDGRALWVRTFGSTATDMGNGVAVDQNNNVLLTGSFQYAVDFGGGPRTSQLYGGADVIVAKYTTDGAHIWSKNFVSNSADIGTAIATDSTGNIAVTGYFMGQVNFGGGNLNSADGTEDVFVVKLTPNGAHVWSRAFGENVFSDRGTTVAMDSSGNVLLGGVFQLTVDFGGGQLTSASNNDVFVAKYAAASGAHLWSKRFGGSGADSVARLAVDAANNVIFTGGFASSINFGGGSLATAGSTDIYLAKLNSIGAHVWSKRFGGTDVDEGLGVAVAKNTGEVTTTGRFLGSTHFGGGVLTSAGSYDIFLLRTGP